MANVKDDDAESLDFADEEQPLGPDAYRNRRKPNLRMNQPAAVEAAMTTEEILTQLNARRCTDGCTPPADAWRHLIAGAAWFDADRTWPPGKARHTMAVIWTKAGARLRWSGNADAWINYPVTE